MASLVIMRPNEQPARDVAIVEGATLDEPRSREARAVMAALTAALCTIVVGIVLVSDASSAIHDPWLLVMLIGLVLWLDYAEIDLFIRGKMSPATVPTLALACFFGPLGPIAAEAAVALNSAAKREWVVGWTFDFAALSIAGTLAALTFGALPSDGGAVLLAATAAGAVYYVANSLFLSTMWVIDEGVNPLQAWRERLAWAWVHYLAYGLFAGLIVLGERKLGPELLLAASLPLLVMWVSQKQYLDRTRKSVEELHRSHDRLEQANRQLSALLDDKERLVEDKQELLLRNHRAFIATVTSLARAIEAKDPYTGGHTERVAEYAVRLAAELGYEDERLRAIEIGGIIHDIGKIGIRDEILLKPGKLDAQDWAEMRRHPEMSSYILGELDLPPEVKEIARSHHERYDGSGYPDGLKGEEIPLSARILSVADALDAMTTDRPYRGAMPLAVAMAEIESQAGQQLCPTVTAALKRNYERDPSWWRAEAPGPSDAVERASISSSR
jgi:putative nucleotidyltransferase with HDIG domain